MGLTGARDNRLRGIAVTIAAAAAIAWFTLWPDQGGPPPVTGSDYLLTDLVLNVLLFVPLGVGLAMQGVRGRSAVAIGTLASIAIELSQLWWIPGRAASFHDVVTNGLGTALGAILVRAWLEKARWRRVAGPPLAAGLVAAWVTGGLLVRPSLPPGALWFGSWRHEFSGTTLFPGQVLSLSVQGMAIPDGPFGPTGVLRERLARADTIRVATDIVTGGPFEGRAQLIGVVSGQGEELVSLWQRGTSVLVRQRLRLSDFGVRTLWLRMDEAVPRSSGDTLRLEFDATRRQLELRVGRAGTEKTTRVRLSAEMFWTGFLPFEYEADNGILGWPLLGTVLIFLVLGLLTAPHRAAAIAVIAMGVLVGPLFGQSVLPGWETILAALIGVGAGWQLSPRLGLGP